MKRESGSSLKRKGKNERIASFRDSKEDGDEEEVDGCSSVALIRHHSFRRTGEVDVSKFHNLE